MRLSETECRRRFGAARVLRLATADEAGRPHLVPATFAATGDDLLFLAVDDKPKRHHRLKRLRNIERNPAVSALVDAYDEDWARLWWVRADGTARVLGPAAGQEPHGSQGPQGPLTWLAGKYPQYGGAPPPGPVIEITVTRWSGWSAAAQPPS